MGKQILSKAYAAKMVIAWAEFETGSNGFRPTSHSLEHKLSIAFKAGFESGQRHQKKLEKASVKS